MCYERSPESVVAREDKVAMTKAPKRVSDSFRAGSSRIWTTEMDYNVEINRRGSQTADNYSLSDH